MNWAKIVADTLTRVEDEVARDGKAKKRVDAGSLVTPREGPIRAMPGGQRFEPNAWTSAPALSLIGRGRLAVALSGRDQGADGDPADERIGVLGEQRLQGEE